MLFFSRSYLHKTSEQHYIPEYCLCVSEKTPRRKIRRKYSEGLHPSSDKFKNTGVKKVLLLVVAPGAKEEHCTIDSLLEKLNLERETYKVVPDLKLANIAVGVGTHSSTYPQAICGWRKGSLKRCTEKDLRTFQDIRKNHFAWVEAGEKQNDAKNFMNCIKEPLKIFPKYGRVIDVVLLAVLHIKMGVTNTMEQKLEYVFPPAMKWPKKLHLVREDYHKQFEGM